MWVDNSILVRAGGQVVAENREAPGRGARIVIDLPAADVS
jgi:hypothetical protein